MMPFKIEYAKRGCSVSFAILLLLATTFLAGCGGIKTIKPHYMSNYQATPLFDGKEQLITVNAFYDDRTTSNKIGEGFNAYGGKLESWVPENDPLLVVENAIIEQLNHSGFSVVRSRGWNYDPNSIPAQVNTRLIVGGKLKTFWVESRPNFWTVTISSKVSFDFYIADTKERTNLYTGQFTGNSQTDHGYRSAGDMQNSLSLALTQAVNKAFQDETVREILLKKWQ
ncbi:hypothetical protein AKJ60_00425 [candidate division MSBL1 archaeon SCGC-AAA385M11]|nr:hypothetical protein AKJ60_00425 [candidate division MSBL1 archaeon SCGC-AAA385M11]